jgi:hypothetical protein
MIRTSIRLGIAALASATMTLVPAALAQAKPQHCHVGSSHTLASDSYARVYGLNGNAYVCIKSSGKTTKLQGASPSASQFALGGKYVGWSSDPVVDPTDPQPGLPNSVVTVMRIPDHFVNDRWYPLQTNENVDKIVVASDGAAAWAISPPPGDDSSYTIVQGTDRQGHPADQFSDDHTDLIGSSLSIHGKTVTWQYTDGTSGSQNLF